MQVIQWQPAARAILAALATEGALERTASRWLGPDANRREEALFWGAIAAVVLLAVSLRLPGLAPPSLYLDDTWVALLARDATFADLLAIRPHHPIGFIVLLALARRLVPGAELSVQILPFAAALALVPLGAWLVRRRTGGLSGGILAAALLALNPTLSASAIRVKPYAMDALLSLLLVVAAERCLVDPSPRRLTLLCFLAPLALLFSYPGALVGAVGFIVAFGVAVSTKAKRRPLAGLAIAFLAAEGALGFLLVYGQSNRALSGYWEWGFVPLQKPIDALGFVASRSALIFGSSFPPGWEALGLLVLLGFAALLHRRETRPTAAFLVALWASFFAAAAMRLYPMDSRTTAFAYPLVALVAAATISTLAHRAHKTLVREGLPAILAAAVVLTSASRVAYPPFEDARLVRTLAAESEPGDTVLIYPHANWAVGYYSGWPVRLVPVDYYGNRFEARLLRDRSITLPGFPGYEDHPEVLVPALEELVSRKPRRVLYLATNVDANRSAAHVRIREFLGASGYGGERLAAAREGELFLFRRRSSRPDSPPELPQAAGSRPGPDSSTQAGP